MRHARQQLVRSVGTVVLASLFVSPGLDAQQAGESAAGIIVGQVIDAQSQSPLGSVQVFVGDLDIGVLTEQNGRFTLEGVPAGTHLVAAQRLGYRPADLEITVGAGERVVQDFQLAEEALALDEIIVTGTPGGSQRRAIGNSVSQVDAAAITERAQVNTMQDLLTTRTPGVTFMRSSGNVGTGSQVRIRGVSSLTLGSQPLIYVDGVRVDNRGNAGPGIRGGAQTSSLDDFNPADIESVEIIKGPAAATLYGTEASAGVIQIITKRGQIGAPQFDLSVSQGSNFMVDPSGKLGTQWALVDGELSNFGEYPNVYEHEKNVYGNDVFQYGRTQTYNLGARGGTETVRYFLSGSWDDQVGVVDYNWNERLGLRGNVSVILPAALTLDVSTGYTTGETSYMQQITEGGIWEMMMWATPREMSSDRRGFLRYTPEELETIAATREYSRFTGSATLTHQPREWLTQRLIVGLDHRSDESEILIPRHELGEDGPFDALSLGQVEITRPLNRETTLDYNASGRYRLNDAIGLTTSFGAQYYSTELNLLEGVGREFATPAIRSIEGATIKDIGQTFVQNKSLGFYVQQEVSLNDRAFLTAALRGDDNSAFGAQFDAAYYPKVSGTWVISEEPFWNIGWVNSLRLRSAWGKAGRQPDTFAAVTLFSPSIGPGGTTATTPNTLGNPELGPEVSTELEVGLEAAILNDRISGEFTYFTQKVEDALLDMALAPSLGFSGSQSENVGRIDNWGWEASLNARAVARPNLALDLGLHGNHAMNEIKDLGDQTPTNTIREGFPYPVYTTDRILSAGFDEFGQPTNVMCDGGTGPDGRRPGGDPVPCSEMAGVELLMGPLFPTYTWGVDATATLFQRLQLFALAEGQYGRTGSNTNVYCRHVPCYSNTLPANLRDDPTYVEAVVRYQSGPTDQMRYVYFDADFWKLREVGARYQLPQSWVERLGVERASITASGRNLWTIWVAQKEIEGARIPDPELTDPGGGSALGQMPAISSFSVSMRLSF